MSVSFKIQKIRVRLAAAVAFVALLSPTARSQQSSNPTTDPNNAPVQIITKSQYDQMIANGELKENNPGVVLRQFIARLLQDLRNGAIVENFIRQNPDVLGLPQLVAAAPKNPATHITLDGNYRTVITAHGISQTIETFGPSTKLSQLSKSIVTSNDPANQLGLYNLAFTQYNNTYAQFCGSSLGNAPVTTDIPPGQISTVGPQQSPCQTLVAPASLISPASLQGAPIAQINSALHTIAANGTNLLHLVPTGVGPGPVACNEELGTSFAPGVNDTSSASTTAFGDMVNNSGFSPSSSGLVANFNFPAKNMLTCIRNQGQRGTCHIFAAISAIEEIIARDTGVYVNLSEQDFMENEKLVWSPDFFNDSGSSGHDLEDAHNNGYKFAFEKTWDYNPSLLQPRPPAYEFIGSCLKYPSSEPGCSATAPQANGFCVLGPLFLCGLSPFQNPTPSPYSSAGVGYIWNPANPDLSVDYIFLSLAFNSAVVLGFNETQAFQTAANGNGFISFTPGNPILRLASDPTLGGHYVHIVGYVSNEDIAANPNTASTTPASGGGYFIVKNSWGANAGDAGYLYMPVDYLKANAFELAVISSVNRN
jgi:Papain family cysteine protease